MSPFVIGAVRAVIEMLGLCMLGQGALYLLAGRHRADNRIYQLFDLLTKAPRQAVAAMLPSTTSTTVIGILTFFMLLILWLGLAYLRNSV